MPIVVRLLSTEIGLGNSIISQYLSVPSNMCGKKHKVGNGRRSGFCFTITQIDYLVICTFYDFVKAPYLPVASYAAGFRGNC